MLYRIAKGLEREALRQASFMLDRGASERLFDHGNVKYALARDKDDRHGRYLVSLETDGSKIHLYLPGGEQLTDLE